MSTRRTRLKSAESRSTPCGTARSSSKSDSINIKRSARGNCLANRFEVADDLELQDEPLQIRVMDYDTYSANDAIGKVYVDLKPLLLRHDGGEAAAATGSDMFSKQAPGVFSMSGWLPIYDTIHGIRGEVNVMVKVELFSDLNKFRQSSCGVPFFCSKYSCKRKFHFNVNINIRLVHPGRISRELHQRLRGGAGGQR